MLIKNWPETIDKIFSISDVDLLFITKDFGVYPPFDLPELPNRVINRYDWGQVRTQIITDLEEWSKKC